MTEHCPDNLISLLLHGQASPDEQASFERHISECESCRLRLEDDCGDRQFWKDLTTLVDDPLDTQWKSSAGPELESALPQTGPHATAKSSLRAVKPKLTRLFETLKPLLAPTDDPHSAGRIGNYEITGIIGSGGMGVVLKAREPVLDRVVAIKVLLPHLAADEACRLRFQREARAAAAIKHPGIIPIYRVDIFGELPYFVMPFEVGPSLQERIERDGPLSIAESLRVAAQISDALSAAHQSGLVHRDIKPSNILLAPGTERALLTDFGLAQTANDNSLTLTGVVAGTPPFMSPEQARGEVVDPRSDLFSLGSVLFAMLKGHPPIRDESTYKVVRRIGDEVMPHLDPSGKEFPEWLGTFISKLHHKDPTKRIQSATECTQLIKLCLAHEHNPLENPLPAELRFLGRIGHRRLSIWTGAIIVVLAACLAGYGVPYLMNTQLKETRPGASNDTSARSKPVDRPILPEPSSSTSPSSDDPLTTSWDDGLDGHLREIRDRISDFQVD